MLSGIPTEITIASFSLVGILTGYVWNDQNARIKKLENHTTSCPFPKIQIHIATIATDVQWIKKELEKSKK
jgi:hypothetical protein